MYQWLFGAFRCFTGSKTYYLRRHGIADLLGHLVEGWATVMGGSGARPFHNPTSLSSPFPLPSMRLCRASLEGLRGSKNNTWRKEERRGGA